MEAGPLGSSEETETDDASDRRRAGTSAGEGQSRDGAQPLGGSGAAGSDDVPDAVGETPEEPQELRPQRKLRPWQLVPIVGLAAPGSLMFAFPLAFEPGGGSGAVVAMLGLLLCGCAAGWGVMAARRVGASRSGLPARGAGRRADWRVVALYSVAVSGLVFLAILRVARLR